jgi:chromosome segregation ATPase
VTAQSIDHLPGWEQVREALVEICSSHDEYDKFFTEMFDQLGAMSRELAQRQLQIENDARQRTNRAIAEASAHQEEARLIMDEAKQERVEINSMQEVVHTQLGKLDAISSEVAEARGELNAMRGELAQVRGELQQRPDSLQSKPVAEPDPRIEARFRQQIQQIQQMARQQESLEQERKELEFELDAVRGRAAELSESLSEQKRTAIQQQTEWAKEFKRMRMLLESMSGRLADGFAVPVATGPAPAAPSSAPAHAPSQDPALDTVLAQFELLQRDVTRRRNQIAC